ncbi:hypothetical protein D6833_00215 [Candidatus Parcubacteria bacterium]|nr:MAG: hypothetical protein D6833_00215 [Candidatus Parcubacteria bacterium]
MKELSQVAFELSRFPSFRHFSESRFRLSSRLGQVRDGRANPEVGAEVVCSSIIFLGLLGLPSLLRCDQMLRTFVGKSWFGRTHAVSDSTMARSLESMTLAPVRALLQDSYLLGRSFGLSKCPVRFGKLRLGLVDGSDFGHFLASALEVLGMESFFVDLEPYPGQRTGKELPASYALLRRNRERFGEQFVDILMADGLYLNQPFFTLCLEELRSDVLIKSRDFRRDLAQDALGLFTDEAILAEAEKSRSPSSESAVVCVEGFDTERLCAYRTLMAHGFRLAGVDAPLQVAWVRETPVYPSQQQKLKADKKGSGFCKEGETEFLVIASSRYLSRPLDAEEMRQLAHWRWDQENNGFKAANQRVNTKRLYSHDPHAKLALLMLLLTTFNLLNLYLHQYGKSLAPFPGMKQTKVFQQDMLHIFAFVAAFGEAFHYR